MSASASAPRLGIDLGGTKIEVAVVAPDGKFLFRQRCPTPQHDYGGTISAIAALVDQAVHEQPNCARGLGVAIPGTLSPATGLVKNANSTWLNGRPFDRDLATALARPVRVANDANCFALSEAHDGAGAGARVVFGVIAGTGLGGGVVVNGEVLTGAHAIAGEWGHNPLPSPAADERPGPLCYCGRHGCLETWLSGPAFAADYARLAGTFKAPPDIVSAARYNDPHARRTLERWLDRFARALAGVINVLDPDVIVFGGGLSNVAELYEKLHERLPAHVFSDTVTTPLRRAQHGDSSGVRGAAWLWNHD